MKAKQALEVIRLRLEEPDALEHVPIHIAADVEQIIHEYRSMSSDGVS